MEETWPKNTNAQANSDQSANGKRIEAGEEWVWCRGWGQVGGATVRRTSAVVDLGRQLARLGRVIGGVVRVDDRALSEAELLALARRHFGNQPHRPPLATPGQERREAR